MGRLSVELCGITLDNPVIPASGTFGYGYEFAEIYDINCLGTFSFKGTTREPRFGNPTPRIAETPMGMLNAVGLQNPGVERVISEELPRLAKVFRKPVMANVSGFSVEEYVEVCRRLDEQPQVGWLEVNISCPNVHGGGMSFGTDPRSAAEVTRAVKAAVKKAMRVLSALDVDLCNLHAAGTSAMMEAALEGLTRPNGTRPLLLAVTQLTSTDQAAMERDLLIREPLERVVLHYAQTARRAGLDGVVCSPLEAGQVHAACGEDFLTVTPGVRFADGERGDQKRVTTPAEAKKLGSDYIVVGRPITAAKDPAEAYLRCVEEFVG